MQVFQDNDDDSHIRAAQAARAALDTPTWDEQAASIATAEDPATATALQLIAAQYAEANPETATGPLGKWVEDWPAFWATDHLSEQFFSAPILAEGRGHVLYAPAKTGKSLLVLEMVCSIVTGRPFLDMPAGAPRRVLYLDYEMVASDLFERLMAFGYSAKDDLSHLRYVRMPGIAPLDTFEGGQAVLQDALSWGAELVVVDTTARAVRGEENASETTRDLYRHTLMLLKQSGITTLRVDHAGKQSDAGMRGSSAKADDVDIVWKLTPSEEGEDRYLLEATHRRVGWVPERVEIVRTQHAPRHRRFTNDFVSPPTETQKAFIQHADAASLPTAGVSVSEARDRYMLDFENKHFASSQLIRHERDIIAGHRRDPMEAFR